MLLGKPVPLTPQTTAWEGVVSDLCWGTAGYLQVVMIPPTSGYAITNVVLRWPADIPSIKLIISWNFSDFVNVLMFRSKKVIHKPSRACAHQLTEVSSQSDEWYRSAYGTNIHANIHFYIYIEDKPLRHGHPSAHYLFRINGWTLMWEFVSIVEEVCLPLSIPSTI
jgi:hypothetical protein